MQGIESEFERYFSRVYRFALALTHNEDAAEELTQQCFFKALESSDGFERRCDPVTWLCSIAKNEYFNTLRGTARRRRHSGEVMPDDAVTPSFEAALLSSQDAMLLHHKLHGLPEPYRELFMLRVFGELRFAQIAALFGKSESWARVCYYRAKCMLQQSIKEESNV